MLRYKRPDKSRAEAKFINRFIRPLAPNEDEVGNLWTIVGDTAPTTLFSSHTDTVHKAGGKQDLLVDSNLGIVMADNSNCLGADDTTGVWIMLHMIEARIPGLYVFHRGEEVGGRGSDHFSRNFTLLDGIKRAVAFDRANDTDIITHQIVGRCCSDEFANALSKLLDMSPCSGGTFTDTANYVDVVPECTNISVGYGSQHGPFEYQDLFFAEELLDKVLTLDWDSLPTVRNPFIFEDLPEYGGGRYNRWDNFYSLEDWVQDFPEKAAQLLNQNGIVTPEDAEAWLM